MEKKQAFKQGLQGGIPIALGYLSVSFTFGMMASSQGIPVSAAVVISLTNLTSAGYGSICIIIGNGINTVYDQSSLCIDVIVTFSKGGIQYVKTGTNADILWDYR